MLDALSIDRADEQVGADILRRALESPIRHIADNAGAERRSWLPRCVTARAGPGPSWQQSGAGLHAPVRLWWVHSGSMARVEVGLGMQSSGARLERGWAELGVAVSSASHGHSASCGKSQLPESD